MTGAGREGGRGRDAGAGTPRPAGRAVALLLAATTSALLGLVALVPGHAGAGELAVARPVGVRAVLDRVDRSGVMVSFHFQKDLAAEDEGALAPDPDASTEVFRRWRMSLRVPGFVVRDRRTVLLSDLFVPDGAVRSVEVETHDGKRVAGRLSAFLPHCAAAVVTASEDLSAEPVPFATQTSGSTPATDAADLDAALFVASLAEGAHGNEAWAEPVSTVRRRARVDDGPPGLAFGRPERAAAGLSGTDAARTIDLVAASDGTPVGFRCGASLDGGSPGWRGADVLSDLERAVPLVSLQDRARALGAQSFVHAVRIAFRTGSSDDEPAGLSSGDASAAEPLPEAETRWWGLAIAPDALLVPAALSPSAVARIARVQVEESGGPLFDARYEGRVKDLGAFVVRLVGGTLEALPDERPAAPAADAAFLVHRTAWRAGSRRDHVAYDRSRGLARGYGDRLYLASETAIDAGSFLLGVDGRVLGFAAMLMPADAERVPGRGRPDDGTRGVTAALFSDLGSPASLADALDRRVLPASSREARRLVWLGVEVEPVRGAAVADALDIAAPTRDGTRGLIVDAVYESSPATKAGLRVDDVLLSARRTSGPGSDAPPVNLRDTAAASEWIEGSEVPRPWAPRMNALVKLLATWGEGTTYELEVLRDDAVIKVAAAVEVGPRDVTTAAESSDDETGLAVKELTYEVRHGLRLAKDAAGVLVSSVEEGSPAAQAHILANEVMIELDSKPLDSPAAFVERLAEARRAGKREVRAVILRLDRTRFVDLRVTSASAQTPPGR